MRCRAVVYLLGHLCVTSLSFAWALALWHNFFVHLGWLIAVLAYFLWMGSKHYVHVTVKKMGPLLQRQKLEDARLKTLHLMEEQRKKNVERQQGRDGSVE